MTLAVFLIGLILSISLLIYFTIVEIKASVFPRLGFIDNDIQIDNIKFYKVKEKITL